MKNQVRTANFEKLNNREEAMGLAVDYSTIFFPKLKPVGIATFNSPK